MWKGRGTTKTENSKHSTIQSRFRAEIIHVVVLTLVLFAFWIVLSGKMEAKYLTIGFVSAMVIAIITRPLLIIPAERKGSWLAVWDLPWLRLIVYFPWWFWQLVLSNVAMVAIILNPKLPLQPQIITFKKHFPHPVGYFILANSITLTPGTLTIDVDGDEFMVHCVQDCMAKSLVPDQGEGDMECRVGLCFGVEPAPVGGKKRG